MDRQEILTTKEELLSVLRQAIENVKEITEEDIEKRKTKINLSNATGFYVSNKMIHFWIVKPD